MFSLDFKLKYEILLQMISTTVLSISFFLTDNRWSMLSF